MTALLPPAWIRERPHLTISPPLWHAEQTVTAAGIRVTTCAEVIGPDQVEIRADGRDDHGDVCATCQEHVGEVG